MLNRDSSTEILVENDEDSNGLEVLISFNKNVIKLTKALENTQNIRKSCEKINKLLKERNDNQK